MKTEKGEVVRVQAGRRVILPIAFCEKKGIRENDLLSIECVKKVELSFVKIKQGGEGEAGERTKV